MLLIVSCADLNYLEETAGGPNLTLAMLPKSKKIVLVQVNLLWHCNFYTDCPALANARWTLGYMQTIWSR